MSALLTKGTKQFTTDVENQTRLVTKIRWVIESANGRVKQWRLFDEVLPNSLLKIVEELVAIVFSLLNCYGSPLTQSISKDEHLAAKMQQLCHETNEFSNYVTKLKDKSERQSQWKELDGLDTVPDFPKLTFDEPNDITLGE